jgi:acetylornithine deacetylase/succinyl-diaminopimelate desuccinylase-like protein
MAGAAADCLGTLLAEEGFVVERPVAGHPASPAVAVRWTTKPPGRTLQLDGHLDTVHLPFVAPRVTGDHLTGSGACDMKGGLAAALEALLILRDTETLRAGSVLLTAHDLHEAPWGYGAQLDLMIESGYVGDAVLIPEPLSTCLPVVGRGCATWKVSIRRAGAAVHEVMRPADEPSVIAAGAKLVTRLEHLDQALATQSDPRAGRASVFVGQIHSGEIYNQYPQECWLEGTERWLPGTPRGERERQFRQVLDELARDTHVTIDCDYHFIRDAFRLDPGASVVTAFQQAFTTVTGAALPAGPKPFVDDGNSFWARGVPAITHGARAGGQHTVHEWVSIDDLLRVAQVYALTAIAFCPNASG